MYYILDTSYSKCFFIIIGTPIMLRSCLYGVHSLKSSPVFMAVGFTARDLKLLKALQFAKCVKCVFYALKEGNVQITS